ncbi:MAG: hypothetical protein A2655_01740 [Candidatus Yanofskybacteria bacterium RIFCSPHIGHO2_01_FULL_43_42]|uniref:Uncharacterized protein n=1 Tax=Candidatus Yanofskybacteria bacterium RIFCSPLOWO2_01_FULL_43_22 TaxID=1802695 RepID=A0A1F8GGU7_9BACT|nr:MAG: hypothetical protein A2655_01740 [Candidatus Yanofskybacteria bacterium RIFCSPHIGHO2_01_FULL_43_42]OGN13199.1 MAG: hypothetical protein A3D48_02645 [Candidatus Yanofskybacteria bacterium RIFCSPHIGHO2_02_FULL_43_17]OGN24614.1 MAG: hypothetical protein A3A13_00870 [Candidatus Yanofskybacteria bacterium RIFCSPLOWO2_01_FULL_43_22]
MNAPIYLIESKTRQDLAATFMRFQEYYESPEFKGKVFSVDDFAHWYARKFGSFSYSRDWYGFNIPGTVLAPFKNGDFNPLTPREQQLIDFCGSVGENSYIIGVTPSAEYFKETVQHEFIHGAFYINSEYRKEIIGCVRDFNIEPVYKGLMKMGYCDDVLIDETNAYVLVEPDTIQEYSSLRNTKKLREQLDKIFEKFFGFSVLKTEVSALLARTKRVLI